MRKLKRRVYEKHLELLESELNQLTNWLQHSGKRMVIVLEGRDTAGKGGAITALTRRLNPRQVRVVALAKPTDRERTQWYFQRYVAYLPAAGELVIFDRSWYNRAGVEQLMGFCTQTEYERFLRQTPIFEKMLVDDGVLLYKYWLAVDQHLQEERFAERANDPLKRWKLSPIDLQARERYVEYGRLRDTMFDATHTTFAPWFVVNFNDQRRGRLDFIRHLLDQVPDTQVPEITQSLPPLKQKPAKERFAGRVKPIARQY